MALKMNGLISLSLTYDRWNCILYILQDNITTNYWIKIENNKY